MNLEDKGEQEISKRDTRSSRFAGFAFKLGKAPEKFAQELQKPPLFVRLGRVVGWPILLMGDTLLDRDRPLKGRASVFRVLATKDELDRELMLVLDCPISIVGTRACRILIVDRDFGPLSAPRPRRDDVSPALLFDEKSEVEVRPVGFEPTTYV